MSDLNIVVILSPDKIWKKNLNLYLKIPCLPAGRFSHPAVAGFLQNDLLLLSINTDNMCRFIYKKVEELIFQFPQPEWKELQNNIGP